MAWMMDTYSMQSGYAVPEIVTGKPISIGGSVFRHEATGAGVVMVVARACDRLGWALAGQRCVVQGFGNVGGVAAAELQARGAVVVAVSDVSGGLHAAAGLDIASLHAYAREHGSLEGCTAGRAPHERGAARARMRHPRARRARGSDHGRERTADPGAARRGGRERPDVHRGGRDPLGPRDPRPARRPHERWRRDRLLLRVGAGSRSSLLDARRDPREARRDARERVRSRVGSRRRTRRAAPHRRRSSPGSARSRAHSRRAGSSREHRPGSDGVEPRAATGRRDSRSGGRAATANGGSCRLRHRRRAARRRRDAGRRSCGRSSPPAPTRSATELRAIAERPHLTIGPDVPLEEAFRFLEAEDAERVPVVDEHQRLLGVLSRSVLQRRLAEDEDEPLPPAA